MEAQKLCEKSVRAYSQALANLDQSKETILEITNDFQLIIEEFKELIVQAK